MLNYANAKKLDENSSAVYALDLLNDIESDMKGLSQELMQMAFYAENGGMVQNEQLFVCSGNALLMADGIGEALAIVAEAIRSNR